MALQAETTACRNHRLPWVLPWGRAGSPAQRTGNHDLLASFGLAGLYKSVVGKPARPIVKFKNVAGDVRLYR